MSSTNSNNIKPHLCVFRPTDDCWSGYDSVNGVRTKGSRYWRAMFCNDGSVSILPHVVDMMENAYTTTTYPCYCPRCDSYAPCNFVYQPPDNGDISLHRVFVVSEKLARPDLRPRFKNDYYYFCPHNPCLESAAADRAVSMVKVEKQTIRHDDVVVCSVCEKTQCFIRHFCNDKQQFDKVMAAMLEQLSAVVETNQ